MKLLPAELKLVNRALSDLINLAALHHLMPMVCMSCGRVYEVKSADGAPGVGTGLCSLDCGDNKQLEAFYDA